MQRLGAVLVISTVLWVQPALAVFYTYSEWATLPAGPRAVYMSGAYDSFTSFADNPIGARGAAHYQACVAKSGMTTGQFATNILNHANGKPALHTKPAVHAMLDYLIAACGLPPKPN
jgi:hypothetical protein